MPRQHNFTISHLQSAMYSSIVYRLAPTQPALNPSPMALNSTQNV